MPPPKKYDVCLSFAGEDREYVRRLARLLANAGVRVFFDEFAKTELWGKDLYSHLDEIYQNAARYCIVFLSKYYARKVWTNHERQSAQARAIRQHAEYVLPVRFDNTRIKGVRNTIGYIDLRTTTSEQLCDLIIKKLGPQQKKNFLPPNPDRLFKRLGAKSAKRKTEVGFAASAFFNTLERMSATERRTVFGIFLNGCPAELPDNIHINLDLIRRILETSTTRVVDTVSGLESLGFYWKVRKGHSPRSKETDPTLVIEWHDMHVENPGNFTEVANAMMALATENYCTKCSHKALQNLDFSSLATVTRKLESHLT